ncbi:hypothetical protein HMPREF9406_0939 [Clostridium sp. HGF2]|nr:hypothetical protein HMPREF9406_0939 [Clostridium sp. HGF2]
MKRGKVENDQKADIKQPVSDRVYIVVIVSATSTEMFITACGISTGFS